ncbi:Putative AC transposase [Linum perenne]
MNPLSMSKTCNPEKSISHAAPKEGMGDKPNRMDAHSILLARISQCAVQSMGIPAATERQAVAAMIMLDELPFRFVEHVRFQRLMENACPMFDMPFRKIVQADCLKMFLQKKTNLQEYFLSRCAGRVYITTDCWTSIHNINYMCITTHFIDVDWKLNKKILNFCEIKSHMGIDIADSVADCLEEWNLKNVFCITMDNATANDTTIIHLRDKFQTVLWNSTYLMLESAGKFEKPFQSLEGKDPSYKYDLLAKRYNNLVLGPPRVEDWISIRNLTKYIKFFYDLTLVASGSSYVISHLFVREMGKVFFHSHQMEASEDEATRNMASRMSKKLGKYWSKKDGRNDRLNRLVYIALVLDPRHKMEYPKFALKKLYGDVRENDFRVAARGGFLGRRIRRFRISCGGGGEVGAIGEGEVVEEVDCFAAGEEEESDGDEEDEKEEEESDQ